MSIPEYNVNKTKTRPNREIGGLEMVARIGLILIGALIFSLVLNIPLILFEVPSSGATQVINVFLFIAGGLAGNRFYDMQNGLPDSAKPVNFQRPKGSQPPGYRRPQRGEIPTWYRKPKDPPSRRGR